MIINNIMKLGLSFDSNIASLSVSDVKRMVKNCDLGIALLPEDHLLAKNILDKVNIYSSIEELLTRFKPDYLYLSLNELSKYEQIEKVLASECALIVDDIPFLDGNDLSNLAPNSIAGDDDIIIINKYINAFSCMSKYIEAQDLGKFQEATYSRVALVEPELYWKYPLPNVIPWIYSLPGGVFHKLLASPLFIIKKIAGDLDIDHTKEHVNGYLPCNLSDHVSIYLKGNNNRIKIELSFDDKIDKDILYLRFSKADVWIDFVEGSITIKDGSKQRKIELDIKTKRGLFRKSKTFASTDITKIIDCEFDFANNKHNIADIRFYLSLLDSIWRNFSDLHISRDSIVRSNNENLPVVLVTGGTGQLGSVLIKELIENKYHVRLLVRKLSNIDKFKHMDLDIFFGDIADKRSLQQAIANVDYVIHAAADTIGNKLGGETNTISGGDNVVSLCQEYNIKNLVFISTCNVYEIATMKKGEIINENSQIETSPELRGFYTYDKVITENRVLDKMKTGKLNAVCLRPGTYYGENAETFTPMLGQSIKSKYFFIIGNGSMKLPLVYLGNVVDAIITVLAKSNSVGKVYNVIDQEPVTKKDYVDKLLRELYPGSHFYYIPYNLIYLLVWFLEKIARLLKFKPFLTIYRLKSSQNMVKYESKKLHDDLGWDAPYTISEAFQKIIKSKHNINVNR